MKELTLKILKPAILLGLFGLLGVIVLASINLLTYDTIAENEREALLQSLNEIIPESEYDNDLIHDQKTLPAEAFYSQQPVIAFPVLKQGKPVAVIFETTSPNGYQGSIKMVVGVRVADKSLAGVRIVTHNETPGLGDKMELEKSDWVLGFNGKSLQNVQLSHWAVKKDGGDFDQFTGATITPRAVVKSVRDVLVWSDKNIDQLFKSNADSTEKEQTRPK